MLIMDITPRAHTDTTSKTDEMWRLMAEGLGRSPAPRVFGFVSNHPGLESPYRPPPSLLILSVLSL